MKENMMFKKFKKCLAIGTLATSLAVTPVGNFVNPTMVKESEAKKKKPKVKLTVKRASGNKKTKTLKSGKNYNEKYSIKLKNGKKKFPAKKYSIILREYDSVKAVTPKDGVENYSSKLGVVKKVIKKGKKASGIKVKYFVDPNVKLKLQQKVKIICTYILKGKKKTIKKTLKNTRYVVGSDYNKVTIPEPTEETVIIEPSATPVVSPAPTIPAAPTATPVATPSASVAPTTKPSATPVPSIDPRTIVEDPKDTIYYDENGNPYYGTPQPLPTVKPSTAPTPTTTPIVNRYNGMTIVSDESSYEGANKRLLNQNYGKGIVLNSIDPLINTISFDAYSGLVETNKYLDYLKLTAKDKNGNDISNNIRIYDYKLKTNKVNGKDNTVIIEVVDNYGNLYSQYLNVNLRDEFTLMNMPTGEIVVDSDANYETYYEVYQLNFDPTIIAETDKVKMEKEHIVYNKQTNPLVLK